MEGIQWDMKLFLNGLDVTGSDSQPVLMFPLVVTVLVVVLLILVPILHLQLLYLGKMFRSA